MIARLALVAALLLSTPAAANPAFIERDTELEYPEAMMALQHAITEAGYQIRFIQPVDVGLRKRGLEVGRYRVVHFDDGARSQALLARHPELLVHLPLRITLFSNDGTLRISALRPSLLADGSSPDARRALAAWEADLQRIIAGVE